jgi:hypothetical protein
MGTYDFGFTLTGPQGQNFDGQSLSFKIQSTGTLTLANVVTGTGGGNPGAPYFFVADIGAGCTPATGGASTSCADGTGFIGATLAPVPGPIAGAGLPGLMLAALGMVGLGRRRKKLASV